jgi:hypothetical protein
MKCNKIKSEKFLMNFLGAIFNIIIDNNFDIYLTNIFMPKSFIKNERILIFFFIKNLSQSDIKYD